MWFFKLLKLEFSEWLNLFIRALPASPICNKVRNKYWKIRIQNHKKNLQIGRMTNFYNCNKIEVGENFSIGENSSIDASNSEFGILFENDVLIASNFFIRTANHRFDDLNIPIWKQGHRSKTIEYFGKKYNVIIESDVWIGQNVIILSGVKIGKGSVIGAGAIVVKSIPPYSIVVAEKAKILKNRHY